MNKINRILLVIGILIITLVFCIIFSKTSMAYEFNLDLGTVDQNIVSYFPIHQSGIGDVYCTQKHGQVRRLASGLGPKYATTGRYSFTDSPVDQEYAYLYYEVGGTADKRMQVAIWIASELNDNVGDYDLSAYVPEAKRLLAEARAFKNYYIKIQSGKIFEDRTNYSNVKMGYDYASKSYIVGPFQMNYIEQEINGKIFSKLTSMTLTQYTISGSQETSFSFIKRDGSSVSTKYPASGEEFYVKFKGIDGVRSMSMSAKMHYVKEYRGWYSLAQNVKEVNDTATVNYQDVIVFDDGMPEKIEVDETFRMPASSGDDVQLIMKLGGYVWIDKEQGKETLVNGYRDGGESALPGVIVTLYKTGESSPCVLYDKDKKKVANPRTTDGGGYYEFDGLSSGDGDKYYVTFEYDGLNYQDTLYAAGQTGEKANLESEFGVSPWEKNSKGVEDAGQRSAINAMFANIGSYPENYKSPTTGRGNATFTRDDGKLKAAKSGGWSNMQSQMSAGTNLTKDVVKSCYQSAAGGGEDGTRITGFIMDSYIKLRTKFDYPCFEKYTIGKKDVTIAGVTYRAIYDGQLRINQGFYLRPQGDLSLMKDLYNAEVYINGKKHVYEYNAREALMNGNSEYWEVQVRNSDAAYTQATYTRTIYGADYLYTAARYSALGATTDDELQVYVTYKIAVSNRSSTIDMSVDEIVDYYDNDYEVVEAGYGTRRAPGGNAAKVSTTSRYGSGTQYHTQAAGEGLSAVYFSGPGGKLQPGEVAYLYVKCRVKKQNSLVLLDEDGSFKANVAEINGYSTWYSAGTTVPGGKDFKNVGGQVAGVLDKNSTPGNLRSGFRSDTFDENDTDHAPKFYLIRTKDERSIDGAVWDDERNKTVDSAVIGDGIRNGEPLINGVKVQLVEVKNGNQYVWDEITTGTTSLKEIIPGKTYSLKGGAGYQFKGYVAGDYFVRFIYGDNYETVLIRGSGLIAGADGLNDKSYNGHDYKSTTYQVGLGGYDPNNAAQNETFGYTYDIAASEAKPNISDAKDILSRRNEVEAYSNGGITNRLAEKLAALGGNEVAYYDNTTVYSGEKKSGAVNHKALIDEAIPNTRMWAETGKINVEVEKNRTTTAYQQETDYQLLGIDFGIEERPKAQLAVNNSVTNIKITLANGEVLFDANDSVANLLWRKGEEHKANYSGRKMLKPDVRADGEGSNGIIQATMDSEIMHGAALQVTYELKVRNIGEIDYKDNSFYYKGQLGNRSSIVKTRANQIIEYVDSNLRYDESKNNTDDWTIMTYEEVNSNELVGLPIMEELKSCSIILVTEQMGAELVPELYGSGTSSVTKELVLTQMITSGNDEDDLEYNNTIELVKSQNTIGRRMAYSIEGNQNPNGPIKEVDADKAETITILPPFGDHKVYYTIGIAVSMILVVGIVVIKKFVLNNK